MMQHKVWQAYQFILYLFRSFHLHGIHSPFVFEFNESIIKEKLKYYAFDHIESLRAKLLLTDKKIHVDDLGAGSQQNNSAIRQINEIAANSLQAEKYAHILFRIVHQFKPKTILELGTSLGISTLYLAKANSDSKVYTIEGSSAIAKIAQLNFDKLKISNIELIVDDFDKALAPILDELEKVDLVYFDGNHREAPTLSYFERCLLHAHEDSIFIFDDIYWSKEMTAAWKTIKNHPKVRVSIDCYKLGIVFFKEDQAKEHFTVYH